MADRECQKVMMHKGGAYPRSCYICGLGPCAKGYPGWYIPKPGEPLADPDTLPRRHPAAPDGDSQ